MKYVSWAAFYEGETDALYLDVLLPRILRDLIAKEGLELVDVPEVPAVRLGQFGRSVENVACEACTFKDAFHLVFIHADTGGRGLERNLSSRSQAYCECMQRLCNWPVDQCITITPRHETEAWLLADPVAVTAAFGYNGSPSEVGIPVNARAAERLPDPKATLKEVSERISGRRRKQAIENTFPAIGQRQDLNILRSSKSFNDFEGRLRMCLRSLRFIK